MVQSAAATGKEASLATTVVVRAGSRHEAAAHCCGQSGIEPTGGEAELRDEEKQVHVSISRSLKPWIQP